MGRSIVATVRALQQHYSLVDQVYCKGSTTVLLYSHYHGRLDPARLAGRSQEC